MKEEFRLTDGEREQAVLLLILLKDAARLFRGRKPDIQMPALRDAWADFQATRVSVVRGG